MHIIKKSPLFMAFLLTLTMTQNSMAENENLFAQNGMIFVGLIAGISTIFSIAIYKHYTGKNKNLKEENNKLRKEKNDSEKDLSRFKKLFDESPTFEPEKKNTFLEMLKGETWRSQKTKDTLDILPIYCTQKDGPNQPRNHNSTNMNNILIPE